MDTGQVKIIDVQDNELLHKHWFDSGGEGAGWGLLAYFPEKETEAQRPCELSNIMEQDGNAIGFKLRFHGPDMATPRETA